MDSPAQPQQPGQPIQPQAQPQAVTPLQPVQSAQPAQNLAQMSSVSPSPQKRFPWLLVGVVVAVVVVVGGGAAFAYEMHWGPFATGQSDTTLIANLETNLQNMHSAVYDAQVSLKSADREANTQPLSISFSAFDALKAPYDRDNDRFQWTGNLQNQLEAYYLSKNKYPATLVQLTVWEGTGGSDSYSYGVATTTDPLTGQPFGYTVTNGGKGYTLAITFETQDAMNYLASSTDAEYGLTTAGKTATFTNKLTAYGNVTPNQPGFVSFFENQNQLLSFLPADMDVTLNVSGTAQWPESSSTAASSSLDTDLNLGTDLQFGDFSASIAGSFLKKGDTFYVDITKFPDLFFDITPIKNQWIAFTVNDLNNLGASTLSFDPSQAQNIEQQQQDSLAQGKLLYALAQQNGVLVATTVPNDSTHPNLRGFSISLVRDKVADFYQQAETQLHADYPTDAQFVFDQTVYDYLNSQDFTNLFNYLSQNTSLTLWLDPKTGFPAEFDSTFRLIPPDSATKLAKTEFLLSTTVNLMNVNQPINIVAPNPTVSLDDAEFLMSGEPKDVYLYNKQIANIQSLRYALQSYNTYAGSYPSDLSGLVITYGDAAKLNSNQAGTTVSTFEAPMKILNSIPNDAYTSQPYIYSAANGEYSLTYGITKPTSTSTPNPFAAGYGIKVANGTNTATSKHFSVQGDAGK